MFNMFYGVFLTRMSGRCHLVSTLPVLPWRTNLRSRSAVRWTTSRTATLSGPRRRNRPRIR